MFVSERVLVPAGSVMMKMDDGRKKVDEFHWALFTDHLVHKRVFHLYANHGRERVVPLRGMRIDDVPDESSKRLIHRMGRWKV